MNKQFNLEKTMHNIKLCFNSFGVPNQVISIQNESIKELKGKEVLVDMLLSPINPSDLIPIYGSYASRIPLPSVPGYEGIGIVRKVAHPDDSDLIGQRVLPLRGEGTWQKYVITQSNHLICVPESIDNFTASQCYINPVTAWILCTEVFQLKQGDFLLMNAGNSSIGQTLAQLSHIIGFKLISIVRSPQAKKEIEPLELCHIIDSSTQSIKDEVLRITHGQGVDAALDSIGGHDGTSLAYLVKENGYFRTIGLLSGKQVDWQSIHKELSISSNMFHLRHWVDTTSDKVWQETFHQIFYYIEKGLWHLPTPSHEFTLNDFKKAFHAFDSPNRNGKILFNIKDS